MSIIQPFLLSKINIYISKGYKLCDILEEYGSGEFESEIIACYYHINNGPDLRDYQKETLEEATKCFKKYKNYKLFWCCGLGKTKMALSIAKNINSNTILIGVPTILLLDQFYEELKYYYPISSIFKFYSKEDINKPKIITNDLLKYLESNNRYKIVLTTYHSSENILLIANTLNFKFDLVILDEAHHLHSKNQKLFNNILEIPFNNRLILTATPYNGAENDKILSLEHSPIFEGKSNTKSISWAIKNNYITDYNIIILNIKDLDDILNLDENKDLVLSSYMCLKCIFSNKSKKIIVYCNKVKNAKKVQEIIGFLLSNYMDDVNLFNPRQKQLVIGNYELNGTDSSEIRKNILNKFKTDEYAIMSSVQLFGEGYDYPKLDSVLFAEKMGSDIRIVQSALRPCRKDPDNPEKIANILLPISYDNISNIKQIIIKMKSVDNIIDKIHIFDNKVKPIEPDTNNIHINDIFRLSNNNKTLLEKIKLEYFKEVSRYNLNQSKYLNNDYTHSTIISCLIKKNLYIISTKTKYRQILLEIWKTMDKETILKTSTFNFNRDKQHKLGFRWNDDIKLSFQSKNANCSFKELIHMINVNKYSMNIVIELENKDRVTIKL